MFRIITIPFNSADNNFPEKELNEFVRNKKGYEYKVEFFRKSNNAFWTVFISYEKELTEKTEFKLEFDWQKKLYEEIRKWRNERAEKEGIPPYLIYTNNQVKEMIINKCLTKGSLKNIDGIGDKKCQEYGEETIEIVKSFLSDKKDSATSEKVIARYLTKEFLRSDLLL